MNIIKYLAGVVTYNPDLVRLTENLTELKKQVDNIVIIDNASKNVSEINYVIESIDERIVLIKNKENSGIAKALLQIMEYAASNEFDWVLSLDQDSVIKEGLIENYTNAVLDSQNSDVAMFTCLIHDRNFKDSKYEEQTKKYIDVEYCITSAALVNVEKYFNTSGYDEIFFIDSVDFDLCYTFRESNYRICRIGYNGLYHEIGRGENRRFLFKNVVVYHHNSFRIYYMARNTILMYKKHKNYSLFRMLRTLFSLYVKIVFFEKNRKSKLKSFFKGMLDSRNIRFT